MSNKWQNRNEIGGILRKANVNSANPEVRTVDLLVFGYACKIFRDDDKAREIDQGKHLIPWMNDMILKIDRYDVRGALYDLTPYEPPPGGYGNRMEYLSSDEQRAEQLCEEERYYYLYRNEQEEALYQEEELKRLRQESSSENESTYNQVQFNYDSPVGPSQEESLTEQGMNDEADKAFCMPTNFEVPTSVQLPETMKQHAIIEKTARFISTQGPQMEILIKAKQSNNQQFDFLVQNNPLNSYYKSVLSALKNGTYPEPEIETPDSLVEDNSSTIDNINSAYEDIFSKPYIPAPTIKYTPSANCAYTQLISKIKGVPLPPPEPEKQQQGTYTPVLLQQNATAVSENGSTSHNNQSKLEIKNSFNPLMLAHYYSSDTENDDDQSGDESDTKNEKSKEIELCFPIPPDYLQNIIDKTAGYVIKNGRQFEETLRIKNDERFTFLFPDNEFYSYYMYKVTGEVTSYVQSSKEDNDKQKLNNGPVSFSIKTKDDQPVSVIRPALPQEASDDESDIKTNSNGTCANDQTQQSVQQQHARCVPEHVQKAIQLVESQLMARNAQLGMAAVQSRSRFDIDHTGTIAPKLPTVPSVIITVDQPLVKAVNSQQKELKRAEEKVKDKLAQIAREKLGGLLSKEKQLQIERKRKAMAFLNQIKGTTQQNSSDLKLPITTYVDDKNADDSDISSVHSIPISSYGDDKSDTETPANPPNKKEICRTISKNDADDEVQLVSIERRKRRHSKSHIRPRTQTPEVVIISPKRSRSRSPSRHSESRRKRSKSRSHKSKKKSSKRNHHHSKKKSKKRSSSRSTRRNHSDNDQEESDDEISLTSDSSSKKLKIRSRSHKKKSSRRRER